MDKVGAIFEANAGQEHRLAMAYGSTLVHLGGLFMQGQAGKALSASHGDIHPNVAIVEAVLFLDELGKRPVVRWLENDLGLDDGHPVLEDIYEGLPIACTMIAQKWPDSGIDVLGLIRKRAYMSRDMGENSALLSDWLSSSAGGSVPATSRKSIMDIRLAPLDSLCLMFATNCVPAVSETLKGLASHMLDQSA